MSWYPIQSGWRSRLRSVEQAVAALYGTRNLSGRRVVGLNETSLVAFSYEWIAPDGVRVHAGSVRINGVGNYAVAETDVTLTGSPEWVFVQFDKVNLAGTIEHSVTEPVGDGRWWRPPLLLLEPYYGAYSVTRICHVGDFCIDVPA